MRNAGVYDRLYARVSVQTGLGEALPQVLRHELCHALHGQDDAVAAAFEELMEGESEAVQIRAPEGHEARSELFASWCEWGASVWSLLEETCPNDPLPTAAVASWHDVWVWSGHQHDQPPPAGEVAWSPPWVPAQMRVSNTTDPRTLAFELEDERGGLASFFLDVASGESVELGPGVNIVPAAVHPTLGLGLLHPQQALQTEEGGAAIFEVPLPSLGPSARRLARLSPTGAWTGLGCAPALAQLFVHNEQVWVAWWDDSDIVWGPVD